MIDLFLMATSHRDAILEKIGWNKDTNGGAPPTQRADDSDEFGIAPPKCTALLGSAAASQVTVPHSNEIDIDTAPHPELIPVPTPYEATPYEATPNESTPNESTPNEATPSPSLPAQAQGYCTRDEDGNVHCYPGPDHSYPVVSTPALNTPVENSPPIGADDETSVDMTPSGMELKIIEDAETSEVPALDSRLSTHSGGVPDLVEDQVDYMEVSQAISTDLITVINE